MQQGNKPVFLLIMSAVIALSAGIWFGFESKTPVPVAQVNGTILPTGKQINEFTLKQNKHDSFTLDNLKNKWSLMFFGYTHCPDVCPTTLATLKQVHTIFEKQNATPPQIIFVSVDPERDLPETMAEYVRYFNEDFIGVTGEISELEKLAKNLGIYFKKAAGSSGDINQDDYLMDHTTSFVLINTEARLAAILRSVTEPVKLAEDIQTVINLKK